MSEFDFLTPIPKTTVSVKLPSRGVLYRDDSPAGNGKVTLAPMTMMEEAVFAEDGLDLSQAIDKVLKRCVQENLDINTLLGADKFFLFMMLRAVTYGSDYTFEWTCTKADARGDTCGQTNTKTVNIPEDFKIKYLGDADKEPFTITLPDCGKEIAFRLLRGHDEPVIAKYAKELEDKRKDGIKVIDTTGVFRLTRHIVSVEGNDVSKAPRDMLMNFISSLVAKDRQHLRDKIKFFTPGLDTAVKLRCEKCDAVHDWDMPFTAEFFRTVSDDETIPMADEIRSNVLPRDEA